MSRAVQLWVMVALNQAGTISAGTMSKAEIEDSYKISRRIEGEERGLDYATMVFTSTQQEVGPAPPAPAHTLPLGSRRHKAAAELH